MDFFQRQEKARRNTTWLVVYFILGVSLMLVTVNVVFAGVFRYQQYEKQGIAGLWSPQLAAWVSLGTLAVIAFGSLYKTVELSSGGSVIANALGGQPVDENSRDPDLRKLLNVVEEMSIASGVPRPEIYVLPDEKGINAFAAGTRPDNAVIGVTEGCIRHLSRDELQGVIAHEFSHILNGDMRLNFRLIGVIFGLICIMLVGRVMLEALWRGGSRRSSSDKKDGNTVPLILIAVALLVIGWLGSFFGRLIQAAVSRQREFLADASAVQFTRNPLGLAGALKKVGGFAYGSKLESAHAAEASHMFFSNGLRQSFLGFTATHPPLEDRIRLLDPAWSGDFTTVLSDAAHERHEYLEQLKHPVRPSRAAPPIAPTPEIQALLGLQAAAGLTTTPMPAREVVNQFTAPAPQHLEFAANFKAGLPPRLAAACEDPLAATALLFGILLSPDAAQRPAQLAAARQHIDAPAFDELRRLDAELSSLDPSFKLPLALLALPALRRMSPGQYAKFAQSVTDLVHADQQIDLFEFALQKIVLRHLEPHFKPPRRAIAQFYSLNKLLPDCAVLLSALAHVGHHTPAEIQQSFQKGAALLPDGQTLALMPLARCGLAEIDAALDKLNLVTFPLKRTVLNACAHVVAADGVVQWREAELLRAIADALDCPVPPFVQGA